MAAISSAGGAAAAQALTGGSNLGLPAADRAPLITPAEALQRRRPANNHDVQILMPAMDGNLKNKGKYMMTVAESRALLYHQQLERAHAAAEAARILHLISRVFQVMVFILGTGVLFGAFASSLRFPDLLFIPTSLLVVVALVIPSSMSWFHQTLAHVILTMYLCCLSVFNQKPLQPHYDYGCRRFQISQFLQASVAIASFFLPLYRFLNVHTDLIEPNLKSFILFFYILALITAVISISSVTITFFALRNPMEWSILMYYEEVLAAKLSSGYQQRGGDDDLFGEVAFKILGRMLTEASQLKEIVGQCKGLMTYLYAHRRGMDYVQKALEGGDNKFQEAAINMVGFWADPYWGLELEEVKLPKELLERVAEKLMTVGHGRWVAVNCFGGLARRDPELLVKTTMAPPSRITSDNGGKTVLQRLVELVGESTPQSQSLAVVRTLVLFCNKMMMKGKPQNKLLEPSLIPQPLQDRMVCTLKGLLAEGEPHRLRIHSAYLLFLLGKLDGECIRLIQVIQPRHEVFWYESEKKMLDFFYDHFYKATGHRRRPRYPDIVRPDDTLSIQPRVLPADFVDNINLENINPDQDDDIIKPTYRDW
ncbi:hypothetical protein GOP47_0009943 [Adiantum capillus-veneris]|uniref:Uncharacterized protein n=1 Tax=Adiantum capillus-veneris TaxID=13818 RepID=A0A9D4UYQ0_ADICA|nr:hypothetical protein GOP47_0009943 [Adiantum capillus-veneris]